MDMRVPSHCETCNKIRRDGLSGPTTLLVTPTGFVGGSKYLTNQEKDWSG